MFVARALLIAAFAAALPCAANAQTLTTLYSFEGNTDGGQPTGIVYYAGSLYGTTYQGGAFGGACTAESGCGVVFQVDLASQQEIVLLSVAGGRHGRTPFGAPIFVNSAMYVATFFGGASDNGVLFRFNLFNQGETVLSSFTPGGPSLPYGLVFKDGEIYGASEAGGSARNGNTFKFDLKTRAVTILNTFANGADGANPMAPLIYEAGMLYGTTYNGGAFNGSGDCGCGTVFRVNPTTGSEQVLHRFSSGADGANPISALLYHDGLLYGTTANGGTGCGGGCGTVFSIDPNTGAEVVLHSFAGGKRDGAYPTSSLIFQGDALYGATGDGGRSNAGTIYMIKPGSGEEKVLYSFEGKDGGSDPTQLIYQNGVFYGITRFGGGTACANGGCGTVFEFTP